MRIGRRVRFDGWDDGVYNSKKRPPLCWSEDIVRRQWWKRSGLWRHRLDGKRHGEVADGAPKQVEQRERRLYEVLVLFVSTSLE